jgi:hypothetical protein
MRSLRILIRIFRQREQAYKELSSVLFAARVLARKIEDSSAKTENPGPLSVESRRLINDTKDAEQTLKNLFGRE